MIKRLIFGGLLLAAAGQAAYAAPVVFFGENQSPGSGVSGAPATERGRFLSFLNGVSSYGFENVPAGTQAPLNIAFTGSNGSSLAARLTGSGGVRNDVTTDGRYNTTAGGTNWWDATGSFTLNFTTAISAFGFYGTDIGDFNGRLTLTLTDILGATSTLTVQNTINGNSGSLLFFGLIDSANSYTRITFGNTSGGTDAFGFDDMVIGDRSQIVGTPTGTPPPTNPVPEPATLALVALAIAGMGATTRHARKRLRG